MNQTPTIATTKTDTLGTATEKCLGIPVRYDERLTIICESRGVGPWKEIVVGPAFLRFGPRERQALLLHEVAHCKLFHVEKRILLLIVFPFCIFAYCRDNEFVADKFVKECGYGGDLARAFLKMADRKSVLHPPLMDRILRLTTTNS
jgi:Zn-dependent protease with chaperone function